MYDVLPFPNVNAATTEEQVVQINDYLIQLKEALEFILSDISAENLSQDLVEQLNKLGADIEQSAEDRDDQIQQAFNNGLTVSDVINSPTFGEAVKSEVSNIEFSVNFETGNLEYRHKEM